MTSLHSETGEIPMSFRTRRLRKVIAGRQTRLDVAVSTTLLIVATIGKLLLLQMTWTAADRQWSCTPGDCPAAQRFDLMAIVFVLSLAVGLTFASRAALKMLSRRNAWTFALADAAVTGLCLLTGLWVVGVL